MLNQAIQPKGKDYKKHNSGLSPSGCLGTHFTLKISGNETYNNKDKIVPYSFTDKQNHKEQEKTRLTSGSKFDYTYLCGRL